MAFIRPTSDPKELRRRIFSAVREMYTEVARFPKQEFHFPTSRSACEFLGYSNQDLDSLPLEAVESFAGTGCPFLANCIQHGDTVLDIGCGSGTDLLISAQRTSTSGKVIGIDLTDAMREKAKQNISIADCTNAEVLEGNAEEIPLPDCCVDVITSNGVLNLVPDKVKAFDEMYRVLRPGGRMQIADIALSRRLSPAAKNNPRLWAECVVGAVPEQIYVKMLHNAGFEKVRVLQRIDYFDHSSNPSTKEVARQYGARSIVLTATKPLKSSSFVRRFLDQKFALAGSVTIAFVSSLCTIGPILFASLGLGGFAASRWFSIHRSYFLAAATLMLVLGIYFSFLKNSNTDQCVVDERNLKLRKTSRIALIGAIAIVVLIMLFPYYGQRLFIHSNSDSSNLATFSEIKTTSFRVEGVTCDITAGMCKKALLKHPGVLSAQINYKSGVATIQFDSKRTSPKKLASEILQAGFKTRTE
ncbi:methyltransferase domain-containing protein [bacterium]|nr:methyltransferase domain-containing protein [bacterium]